MSHDELLHRLGDMITFLSRRPPPQYMTIPKSHFVRIRDFWVAKGSTRQRRSKWWRRARRAELRMYRGVVYPIS